MKILNKYILITICLLHITTLFASIAINNPGNIYLFAYSSNDGKSGLNLAWSEDKVNWHEIGTNTSFLNSDYGSWGSQKRMYNPYLIQDKLGTWHCIWSLNNEDNVFAHATSTNLYEWKRQSYPQVMEKGNFQYPEIFYNATQNNYTISWLSNTGENSKNEAYQTITSDFKTFTTAKRIAISDRKNDRIEVLINQKKRTGVIYNVQWSLVKTLIKHEEWIQFHEAERSENLNNDSIQFKNLTPLKASITIKPNQSKKISDLLIGIFFEDINYAADGGLYAELIQNRDFEYNISDTKGKDTTWTNTKAWTVNNTDAKLTIETNFPIHKNNPNYAILDVQKTGSGLINKGFDGIPVKKQHVYNFSVFAKTINALNQDIIVRIKTKNDVVIGESTIKKVSNIWKKYETVIKINKTEPNAVIEIIPTIKGKLALDMVSLFPQNTFKKRKNGLREDLAQTIANLNPKFMRFPGGCVAHGDGINNIYNWKNTIGPLETRVPQPNIWRYHQTVGLGYFEYFQFCEDINAVPLPVIAAGVPCQNSSTGGHGQQCGIPMENMDAYVQDILDLIEWANGDKNTKWGKLRAEAGHPEPFNLKYLGIGNEDLITDIFEERFTLIFNALKEKYPEIIVIGTVGPFYMGTDYEEGWDLATKLKVPMVDEHYYQPPGWFINNQDYYDSYDRSKSKVYLGEYAAHVPNRKMNIQTALSEALYLTSIERNGDIVSMTSFAPLLAKKGNTQWNPDLIYFTNTEVFPTVDYYVQSMYGNNSGDTYIPSQINLSNNDKKIKQRIASSIVVDSKTGDLIIKLVNILPVEVATLLNLSDYISDNSQAIETVLKGNPNDENQIPTTVKLSLNKETTYTLPPYSFSVIRVKTNKL